MHLTILTVGSRGDVQPMIALGVGLRRAGYDVRLATHAIFEPMVRLYGLDFAPLEGNPQAIMQDDEGQSWLESGRNPFRFISGFRRVMEGVIHQGVEDAWNACQDTDAIIITGPAFFVGYSIAEKLKLPFIQAYLQPIHPMTAYPSPIFPSPVKQGGPVYNFLSYLVGGQLFWQMARPAVNRARRQILQMPPLSRLGPFLQIHRAHLPVLYGYSPTVLPKPRNWGDWVHVTGYWFLDHPDWQPPAGLANFLSAGTPPIYIGFGSMAGRDAETMTAIVLEALKQNGKRGLLLTGWGGISQADLPPGVQKIEQAPHDWLFPRMAAVVHHGGAGTTAAAFRAGIPSIVIPFFGDQHFWAGHVYRLGVGPRPLSRKRLTAARLAEAIHRTFNDDTIRLQATNLGKQILAEDGVSQAVAVIKKYLKE
jgi:sterol 3beta-glucosyltransferase